MFFEYNKFKLIIALFVVLGIGIACSSKKDSDKKEETKQEETKKEETKKEDGTESSSYGGSKLYFCEEYRGGKEIGVSEVFTIPSSGGYLTVMIDLRPSGKTIGVGKVDLRITKLSGGSEKIIDTKPFDVQPDWDYIHFDEVTFYSAGLHKITLMKRDGTPVVSGEVEIKYR
ncbi:MAG: hypothetical protein ACRDFC_10185 [Ignavibacteria bacterium]